MQSISACQQSAHNCLPWPLQMDHLLCQRSRNEGGRNSLLDEPVTQRFRNGINRPIAEQMYARPCRQVGPNLPNRGIETNCSHEGSPILGADSKSAAMPGHQV